MIVQVSDTNSGNLKTEKIISHETFVSNDRPFPIIARGKKEKWYAEFLLKNNFNSQTKICGSS